MPEHRVRRGDRFQIVSTGSVATRMRPRISVTYDDGRTRDFTIDHTSAADRSFANNVLGGLVEAPGRVSRATIVAITGVKRGRTYAEVVTLNSNLEVMDLLMADYVGSQMNVQLDQVNNSGPGGGNGFIHNRVIADDIAPVNIEHTLGETNNLRRIDGFIWYYHCSSDVASRALRATVRDLGDGLPTGMTSGSNTTIKNYPSAGTLTLTANEEGVIYVNAVTGKSYAASLDNGALTIEDITTEPDPFPYWASEGDVGELFFLHANEEAADRETIYIIEEDWIYV